MMVVMSVFVNRTGLPSPVDWAKAIRASGFDLELDSDLAPETFTGSLSSKFVGDAAGFSCFREASKRLEVPEHVAAQIAERDTVIHFLTNSNLKDLAASMIASAVLCRISDGFLWATEADQLVPASRALEWAKTSEGAIKTALTALQPKASVPW